MIPSHLEQKRDERGGLSVAKADNMLAVLWLLRSRRRMTASQLAEALECSVRTVYRYIDALCASGVPVMADAGPDGGYSLPDNFRGAPLFFEETELVALFHAAQFAATAGYPHSNALETALVKVRQNLAPDQAAGLERRLSGFVVRQVPRGGTVEPWLGALEQAVADGATVELTYRKVEADEPERRVVDPYGLQFEYGLWYLQAFCHLRQALRSFRVDRVEGLVRTGATFERPADFHLVPQFDDRWIAERVAAGPQTPVRLAGEPAAIAALWDHWYLRHCRVEKWAREALFRLDPRGLDQLPGYLLTFGLNITVVEPEDLRRTLADLAGELAGHHSATAVHER